MVPVNQFVTERSMALPYVDEAKSVLFGKDSPVDLSLIGMDQIAKTIDKQVFCCNSKTFFTVRDCVPPRIYKFIPIEEFKSGDEIRISQIAGNIGVAPAFYSAFAVQWEDRRFVVIEMDNAGKSLGQMSEHLSQQPEIPSLSEEERAFQEMLKEMDLPSDRYEFSPSTQRVTLEEAAQELYGTEEQFFFELFRIIKKLAKSNIAYHDTHMGNMMPVLGDKKSLKLIDFDDAMLMPNRELAIKSIKESIYNERLLERFASLPGLSEKSSKLIEWFNPILRP